MKIGAVISDTQFEKRLNQLVNRLAKKADDLAAPSGFMGQLYRAIADSEEPIGYTAVAEIIGLEPTAKNRWHVHTRLGYLKQNGWIEEDGRSEPGYNNLTHRTYRATPKHEKKYLPSAVKKFNERVDALQARRTRTACLAVTLRPAMAHISTRERNILRARLDGMTLSQIGEQHGVTRERIRQIIERDVEECLALKE